MKPNLDKRRVNLRKNAHAYALNCCVRRALRPLTEFSEGGTGLIVLIAPETGILEDFTLAAIAELYHDPDALLDLDKIGYMKIKRGYLPKNIANEFESDCQDKARAFVIAESRDDLVQSILLAADFILDVDGIQTSDLITAFDEVLGIEVTQEEAVQALTHQRSDLWTAARPGRPMPEVLRRLGQLPSTKTHAYSLNEDVEKTPSLEVMQGYGPAKEWGLQLRDDLRAWSEGKLAWADVDRGMLLSGAPGTGKTTFAAALAKSCGVHLIATSMAKWQAKGHLGDMLKSMRADFNSAKNNTPCILFIDEIDSVGDRAKFKSDYADYSVQVVNALLECIDGNDGREGVVVIGSTNYPDKLDPAIRRAGRLDKHVTIPLPDADARVSILLQYVLGDCTAEELDPLKPLTVDFSGADLARLVRDGRRAARRAGRPLTVNDLKASLPTLMPVVGVYRQSVAVHEAGHTVVGHLLNYGRFVGVAIADGINPHTQKSVGGAAFEIARFGFHHRQTYLDKIATGLAGVAAEKLKLGAFGDGASVDIESDLATATQMATYIEAQAGWGTTLRFTDVSSVDCQEALRGDANLREMVDKLLNEQFERATTILRENMALFDMVAAELFANGSVSPELLSSFIAKAQERQAKKQGRSVH